MKPRECAFGRATATGSPHFALIYKPASFGQSARPTKSCGCAPQDIVFQSQEIGVQGEVMCDCASYATSAQILTFRLVLEKPSASTQHAKKDYHGVQDRQS
jgi:hypothetical protein